jgi:hypothetical protein
MKSKILGILAGIILIPSIGFSQTDAADYLTERYGDFGVQYMSESFIRAAINFVDSTETISQIGTDLREAVFFMESMDRSSMNTLSKGILDCSEDFEYEELVSFSMSGQTSALYGEYDRDDCKAIQLHSYSKESEQFIFLEVIGTIDIVGLMKLVGEGGAQDLGNNLSDITNLLNLDFD